MTRSTFVLILVIVVGIALVCLAVAGKAMTSPAPTPSPSATVTVPASDATVQWARSWERRAQRARTGLSRVRACFGDRAPVPVGTAPERAAPDEAWQQFGRQCRHRAQDWTAKTKAGVAKMRRPGGSGAARWAPAMRYTGWSEYGIRVMVPIGNRECGSPHRWNQSGTPCYGIWQIHICWWGAKGLAWMRDPLNQCRVAWHIFHDVQHDSPNPAWAL